MYRIFKKLLFIFFLAVFVKPLYSYDITPANLEVKRGDIFKYEIFANLNFEQNSKIKAFFSYNASLLEFISIDSSDILDCVPITIVNNVVDEYNIGYLAIECDNTKLGNLLARLNFKALLSIVSIAQFKCDSIFFNDAKQNDIELKLGKIKVIGEPIYQNYPEGLQTITPNPINLWEYGTTNIKFNLKKDSPIKLFLYNSAGIQIAYLESDKFKKGPNSIDFKELLKSDFREFSAGNYIIVLETINGVYNQNFIFIK